MSIQNLYPNVKPSLLLDFANTKQLDPRITFTRASTGTYYDGKTVAKAEENLLTQSGNVAAWSQTLGVSRTENSTTAPDGTITAGLVTVDSSTGRHFVGSQRGGVAAIGSTITGSVFLKASTYGFAAVQLSNATVNANTPRYSISVDLSNGTIGGFTGSLNVSGQAASVVSVGNGWYRVILTMTTAIAGDGGGMNILVTPMPTNGSGYSDGGAILPNFTGDGVSGIFVWGAQAELRSSVTAYTPTTTAPITNYIPVLLTAAAGVPRFEHNPVTGESLGLEIEEPRTNLILRSEEFDTAAWSGVATGVEANTAVSPDGTLDADKVYEGTGSNFQNRFQSVAQTATTYAFSVYAKKGQTDRFVMFAGSPQALLWIDMTTWSVFASTNVVSSSITAVGNGWYRCTLVYTNTSASSFQTGVNLVQVGTTNTVSYTGNGFSGIYIWGAQLEASAFATSYIPTVASQVTRAADSASMTGANFSSWFRKDEGTIYIEGAPGNYLINAAGYWQIDSGVVLPYVKIMYGANTFFGNTFPPTIAPAGATQVGPNKAVHTYSSTGQANCVNGNAVTSNSTVTSMDAATRLWIGWAVTSPQPGGPIRKFAYYPKRLTNAELQAITI
jgi:hypothetical protein